MTASVNTHDSVTPRTGAPLWPAIAAATIFLAYFLWAGSSYDPRLASFWTNTTAGWTLPAPGLFHLAIAGTLLFAALSVIAFRAPASPLGRPGVRRAGAIAILLATAVVHWAIYAYWRPLPLDPTSLAAHLLPPLANAGRIAAYAADMLTASLLIGILSARKTSLWPATLFALHPLVLTQAGDGSWFACVIPFIVFLAAISPRLRPAVRNNLAIWGACLCLVWFSRTPGIAPGTTPFNGLLANLLDAAGAAPGSQRIILWAVEIILQSVVCWLAIAARWDLARTWSHMVLAFALVAPTLLPAGALPLVALLPLAWTRAGWLLSFTVLFSYAAPLVWSPGSAWRLPQWLIYLQMVPVLVVELEELAAALWDHLRLRRQSRALPAAHA